MSAYNGWTNYETWCFNLWITNDEYAYLFALEAKSPQELSDCGETYLRAPFTDELPPSLASDLLNSAHASVNWQEIYEALHEDDEPDDA